jgi:hypothetical protein
MIGPTFGADPILSKILGRLKVSFCEHRRGVLEIFNPRLSGAWTLVGVHHIQVFLDCLGERML